MQDRHFKFHSWSWDAKAINLGPSEGFLFSSSNHMHFPDYVVKIPMELVP